MCPLFFVMYYPSAKYGDDMSSVPTYTHTHAHAYAEWTNILLGVSKENNRHQNTQHKLTDIQSSMIS